MDGTQTLVDKRVWSLLGAAIKGHLYSRLNLRLDSFGLPIIAYADRRAAFGDDPATVKTCLYIPDDSDSDGKRLPQRSFSVRIPTKWIPMVMVVATVKNIWSTIRIPVGVMTGF